MIALVFSYRRSSAVCLTLFTAGAAGIACTCLFVSSTLWLAVSIAAICLGPLAAVFVSYALSRYCLKGEIDELLQADTAAPLEERMRRLTRRMVLGGIKGKLSLEYAYALLYGGKWKEALTAASDALVFAGDKVKPAAYVPMCAAYYGLGEKELFDTFYPRAEKYLQTAKKPTQFVTVCLAALTAMRLSFDGAPDAANTLNGVDGPLPPVLKTATENLKTHIQHQE